MSISIHAATPATGQTTAAAKRNPAERQAFRDLADALKASDVTAARQAYVAILKNAPDGTQFPRGTEFANVGRALIAGDIEGATTAFKSMVQGRVGSLPPLPVPPVSLPPQAPGSPGALLDLMA